MGVGESVLALVAVDSTLRSLLGQQVLGGLRSLQRAGVGRDSFFCWDCVLFGNGVHFRCEMYLN
jgi:hypothetical protein